MNPRPSKRNPNRPKGILMNGVLPFDIAVVGAGAAGLMTAIAASSVSSAVTGRKKPSVLLLDSRKKIGAKILMSGGTRCNVTNTRVLPSDYEGGPKHFVKHVLEAFTPEETRAFFEAIGVPLILEPTGKYFPATHSGKTVLEALIKEAERLSVKLETGVLVRNIKKEGPHFILKGENFEAHAERVVLTTGGLSYPETGSDGTGFLIAKSFGHSLVKRTPALTPLTTPDADWQVLSGVSLEVKLSFFENGKKKAERGGAMLFTHFGFSGPAALDISRFVAGCGAPDRYEIRASFFPGETEEGLKKRFEDVRREHPGKHVKSFFTETLGLPERFAEAFLKKINADSRTPLEQCGARGAGRLIHLFLNYPLEVTGVVGYKKAEVTAGGVDLKEANFSTMESKLVPGLYFAGEILDVDGRIGGFNFQWSWSSGTVAGRSVAAAAVGLD
ncbi:MAG: NAD(P)/FAD-dependent oxidoreductase [Candidatus Omnitrophica bacterium]|nr:NAD(P)/FAD-dependent oxidoreductase [Candidatus Omnitrophota bacterium]